MKSRAIFPTEPISDEARDGRYQVVVDKTGMFALVRWSPDGWVFSSGVPLDFEPTHYHTAAHT